MPDARFMFHANSRRLALVFLFRSFHYAVAVYSTPVTHVYGCVREYPYRYADMRGPLHICAYALQLVLFNRCVRLQYTINYAKKGRRDIVFAYKKSSLSHVEKNTFCDIDNCVWLVGKMEIISSRYQ